MKATEENITRQKWDDRFLELLASPTFQGVADGESDPLFWMPLIAYTMGLRSEEAAQLSVDDFSSDKGILYVKVRQVDGNRVKSEAGTRDVPVHPALIDLGLALLVDKARRGESRRIFPSLTRGATKGTFTENFTKAFNYYRRSHAVYWVGLDFHALRTTFHHHLLDNNCPGAHRRRLMGHEPLDEGERSYAQNGISIKTLYEHVRQVPFEVHRIRSPFHAELLSPHRSRSSLSSFRVIENNTVAVDYNQTHHI